MLMLLGVLQNMTSSFVVTAYKYVLVSKAKFEIFNDYSCGNVISSCLQSSFFVCFFMNENCTNKQSYNLVNNCLMQD